MSVPPNLTVAVDPPSIDPERYRPSRRTRRASTVRQATSHGTAGGNRPMSDFFKGIDPVPFKGPDSDDPLAFRFYEQGPARARQADARAPAHGDRLLALLRLAGRRPVRRPDLRAAVVRRAACPPPSSRPRSPSRCSASSAPTSSPSTTATSPPRAAASPSPTATSAAIADIFAQEDGGDRRQAALGHRQPVLEPPLHGRRRDQPRPRRLRLRRRAGEDDDRRHPRARAAPTTCSGAAARATRPCSTPT